MGACPAVLVSAGVGVAGEIAEVTGGCVIATCGRRAASGAAEPTDEGDCIGRGAGLSRANGGSVSVAGGVGAEPAWGTDDDGSIAGEELRGAVCRATGSEERVAETAPSGAALAAGEAAVASDGRVGGTEISEGRGVSARTMAITSAGVSPRSSAF